MATWMRPGFTARAANPRAKVCLLAVRRIAACALVMQCLGPARAGDALPAQTALAPKPAYTPKGRQMERYKAFARVAKLPTILISNQTTLEVGGAVKADLNGLARLSAKEKEALAGQFGVPAGVVGKVIERAVKSSSSGGAQVAQDLRTAVIDYRFLEGEWGRYHPPAQGQQVKADALAALKAGNLSRAWELYDGLQRPAPPANLRIIAQP